MDSGFLRRVLILTGGVSAAVAALALASGGGGWAARYAAISLFAWGNWALLARALASYARRNPLGLLAALSGKIALLGGFVIYLAAAGLEIGSFLLGLNTFFLTLFAAMAWRGLRAARPRAAAAAAEGSAGRALPQVLAIAVLLAGWMSGAQAAAPATPGHGGGPAAQAATEHAAQGAAEHSAGHEGGHPPEIPNISQLLYEATEDHEHGFGKVMKVLHKGTLEKPLPIVGTLPWENHVFALLAGVIGILLFGAGARRLSAENPSRFQAFVEATVEAFRDFVCSLLGDSMGRRFAPYIAALFIYILINNLMGLVPFLKPATSSLVTTGSLAILTFLIVQATAIAKQGPGGYLFHLAGEPKGAVMWIMSPLFFVLHIIGEFAKPVSLALRLFGNILGKDILLGAFVLLGIGLVSGLGVRAPLPGAPLHFPFLLLGLLLSAIQALVFSLLTTIYILLVLPHGDHDHGGEEAAAAEEGGAH